MFALRAASRVLSMGSRNFATEAAVTLRNGTAISVPLIAGKTLYECFEEADHSLNGRCEGEQECGGCMLHIDEKYLDVLNEIEEDEADVLEEAYKVQPNSRLACAIELTDEMVEALAGVTMVHAEKKPRK
eukprot:TRINITY_DN6033_c0_g1_i1.p1 TRINITY_DN6033_c0_g1~~TRINITY_DN6033_c0_g1_i1.p1  ORF type:complete len:130 (+),score=57.31 TRINITY_DN6033_c0_g1_i1:99-488(+)